MGKINNRARKLDLSAKFLEMGQSLQEEGDINGSVEISMLGTNLVFLASLALSDQDLYSFSVLVDMFLAKKTLDDLTKTNHPIIDMLKKMSDRKSYDEIIDDLERNKEEEEENDEEE